MYQLLLVAINMRGITNRIWKHQNTGESPWFPSGKAKLDKNWMISKFQQIRPNMNCKNLHSWKGNSFAKPSFFGFILVFGSILIYTYIHILFWAWNPKAHQFKVNVWWFPTISIYFPWKRFASSSNWNNLQQRWLVEQAFLGVFWRAKKLASQAPTCPLKRDYPPGN